MSPGNPRGCSQTVLNRLHVPLLGYSSGCCLLKQLESRETFLCCFLCAKKMRERKRRVNFRVLVLAFVKNKIRDI